MPTRILVVWWRLPKPDFSAGERRLVSLLELLARTHRVDFVMPYQKEGEGQAGTELPLRRAGVNVLGSGWPAFARALSRTRYHLVLFEFYHLFEGYAAAIRERQPDAVLVIDSVDVHFAREAAGAKLRLHDQRNVEATRTAELAAYRAADSVIVVTEEDAQVLRQEGGMPRLFVIPILLALRERASRSRKPIVLFIGGFGHAPNVDAVRWFVADVWPLVRQANPEAIFQIIGSQPPPDIVALATEPGVELLGYVPETAPFLDAAAVSVAPLRYGAGMKGKVNEALASGLPLVTTSFGVQGIPAVSGVHLVVAERADDFAAAVVSLLSDSDRARKLSAAGQELARRFSPERVNLLLEEMVADLVPKPDAFASRIRWLAANIKVALRKIVRTSNPSHARG
jgi:glycosyltransferase involved in cell wall biosynthesis